jgi:hypothetical protein
MDQNMPRGVFAVSAGFMALTVVLAFFTERKSPATSNAAAALSPATSG